MDSVSPTAWITLAAAMIGAVGAIVAALIRRSALRDARNRVDIQTANEETADSFFSRAFRIRAAIASHKDQLVLVTAIAFLLATFVLWFHGASGVRERIMRNRENLLGRWQDPQNHSRILSFSEYTLTFETEHSQMTARFHHDSDTSIYNDDWRLSYGFEPDGHLHVAVVRAGRKDLDIVQIAGRYRRYREAGTSSE